MAVMVASAAGALSQLLLLRISKSQPSRELTQRRLTKVDEPLHVAQTGTQERTLERLLKRGDETARMGPASKKDNKIAAAWALYTRSHASPSCCHNRSGGSSRLRCWKRPDSVSAAFDDLTTSRQRLPERRPPVKISCRLQRPSVTRNASPTDILDQRVRHD